MCEALTEKKSVWFRCASGPYSNCSGRCIVTEVFEREDGETIYSLKCNVRSPEVGMRVVLVCSSPRQYKGCGGECIVAAIKESECCCTCVILENIKSHKKTDWLVWESLVQRHVVQIRL